MAESVTHSGVNRARRTLGQRLRELRLERRLSSTELAQLAKMSRSKISKIEHGRVGATDTTIQRLATALGATQETVRELIQIAQFHELEADQNCFALWHKLHADASLIQICTLDIPALLHIPAIALLKAERFYADSIDDYMLDRARRQSLLWDRSKKFFFVFPERSLFSPPLLTREQREVQINRVAEVAAFSNVEIRVVNPHAEVVMDRYGDFGIFDRQIVTLDQSVFNGAGGVVSSVEIYCRQFDNAFAEAIPIEKLLQTSGD